MLSVNVKDNIRAKLKLFSKVITLFIDNVPQELTSNPSSQYKYNSGIQINVKTP